MSNDRRPGSFKDLIVWQKAMDLAVLIHGLTRSLPREEKFGLTSQMRRSAGSIAYNIAEGQARRSTSEFLHFLSLSEGSVAELETQLILSARLSYCTEAAAAPSFSLLDEVRRMLNALRLALLRSRDSSTDGSSARHSSLVTRHSAPKDGNEP